MAVVGAGATGVERRHLTALDNHEQAEQLLTTGETAEDGLALGQVLADARYHRAARRLSDLPVTLGPCPRETASGGSPDGWTGNSSATRSRAPSGSWSTLAPGKRLPAKVQPHVRLILTLDDGQSVHGIKLHDPPA